MVALSMKQLSTTRILVLGAGIAGLSSAAALIRRGAKQVMILDAEPMAFSGASGRNAAIYRPLETDETLVHLAKKSLPLLHELQRGCETRLLTQTGLLFLDQQVESLRQMHEIALRQGVHAELGSNDLARQRSGDFAVTHTGPALYSETGGVLDPHEIGQSLLKYLTRHRVELRFNTEVRHLSLREGRDCACGGVTLTSGEVLEADAVILAAGAKSGPLAHRIGSVVPLLPLQRHLAVLDTDQEIDATTPVVWQLNPEMYFRPEIGGVLVSPCDETPSRSATPQATLDSFETVASQFQETCPPLATAKLRRHWACIRTKAVDGRPVIGMDPNVRGLYWLTGLGGFGMSCGLAAGEVLATSLVTGKPDHLFSPARFHLPF